MQENKLYFKDNRSNKGVIILLLSVISIIVIIGLFSYIKNVSFGTDPSEVLNHTNGEINSVPKTYLSLEEYLNAVIPEPTKAGVSYGINTSLRLEIPKLDFVYDYEPEYYDYCEGKRLEINFTNPKYSEFKFNYKDKTFTYSVNVYDDLYYFSRDLKEQDCYFEGNYGEGYFEDPYNNDFVEAIAKDFISLRNGGYSDDEILEISTIFVQTIPYGTDSSELNRYAYETIYEKEGNCFDKSIILAGIIKELGYETYIIFGDVDYEYHAIVGVVCENGNIDYQGKEICFIETTTPYPIGFDEEIDNKEYLKVSEGEKIFKGTNYGKQISDQINSKIKESEDILEETDNLYYQLIDLEDQMCETDCLSCGGGIVIDSLYCDDAYKYNRLVKEYNDIVEEYNPLIEDYYKKFYEIDKFLFDNY